MWLLYIVLGMPLHIQSSISRFSPSNAIIVGFYFQTENRQLQINSNIKRAMASEEQQAHSPKHTELHVFII